MTDSGNNKKVGADDSFSGGSDPGLAKESDQPSLDVQLKEGAEVPKSSAPQEKALESDSRSAEEGSLKGEGVEDSSGDLKVFEQDEFLKKGRAPTRAAIFHVQSTFNNNIITVSDMKGDTILWSSSGVHGFKGTRKGSVHAAQVTATHVATKAREKGIRRAHVYLNGIGVGRDATVRALHAGKIDIYEINYVMGIPHNGCRARKKRRI